MDDTNLRKIAELQLEVSHLKRDGRDCKAKMISFEADLSNQRKDYIALFEKTIEGMDKITRRLDTANKMFSHIKYYVLGALTVTLFFYNIPLQDVLKFVSKVFV